MASINKAILIGNLGKDPEIRYTQEKVPVASFSIATTESYTNKNGERVENTEWHNIVAWRGLAEISEKYLHKGKQVYIEGKIKTRSYDDKDGVKKYITEIVADVIQMLGRREDDAGSSGQRSEQSSYQKAEQDSSADMSNMPMDDDLPF